MINVYFVVSDRLEKTLVMVDPIKTLDIEAELMRADREMWLAQKVAK